MKVKIFKAYSEELLEKEVNSFISNKKIKDIQFNAVKNFLAQSLTGEYQEVFYAMVLYEDKNAKSNNM